MRAYIPVLLVALAALAPPAAAQPLVTVTEEAQLYTFFPGYSGEPRGSQTDSLSGFGADAAVADLPDGTTLAAVGAIYANPYPFRPAPSTGAVAVYRRPPGGAWTEDAVLRPPDAYDPDAPQRSAVGSVFGHTTHLVPLPSGDALLLVGNPTHDGPGGHDDAYGAVYSFVRDRATGAWAPSGRLDRPVLGPDADPDAALRRLDRFGFAVAATALGGGRARAVVGATDRAVGGRYTGGAFVLARGPDGEWALEAELRPAAHPWTPPASGVGRGEEFERFGWSVAVSAAGDVALVGARHARPGGVERAGVAYVYARDGATGAWAHEATLAAPGPGRPAAFGRDVALVETGAGLAAVVGEPLTRTGGRAHVFVRRRDGHAPPTGDGPGDRPVERWAWDRGPVLAPYLGAHRGAVGNTVSAVARADGTALVVVTARTAGLDGLPVTGAATAFVVGPGLGDALGGTALGAEEVALVRPAVLQRAQYFGGSGTGDAVGLSPSGAMVVGTTAYQHPGVTPRGTAYAFDLGPVAPVSSAGTPGGRPAGVSVSVGPNPSRGAARVALSGAVGAEPVRVVVLDVRGREVAVVHAGPAVGGASWALPALAPGAYAVRAETAAGAATAWITVVR